MNLTQLLESRGTAVAGPGHPHFKPNWVHICCPFCLERPGTHPFACSLGFADGRFGGRCFKCGKHNLTETLKVLLNVPWPEARKLADSVAIGVLAGHEEHAKSGEHGEVLASIELPAGSEDLGPTHRAYLRKRGFDPDQCQGDWDLSAQGPCGAYPFSIIIPVYDADGRLVSWQARDTTGIAHVKYSTAPDSNVKQLLYGEHLVPENRSSVIVVEGALDAWKLGAGYAVATFGVDWSLAQLKRLADRFTHIGVLFDAGSAEQRSAEKLCSNLQALDRTADDLSSFWDWCVGSDPGELSEHDAKEVRDLMF